MVEVSALALSLAKAAAPPAAALLKKVGKEQYDRFVATYTNVFGDHIRATVERCSSIKTILHRDQPISLDSQYVSLLFTAGEDIVHDTRALEYAASAGNAFLVSGLAGCGKSMFMKWAALRLIERVPVTQRIPLFVEIREVPEKELELPFDQIVFNKSSSEISKATFDQFYIGLSEGLFIVMVDGLDEVPVRHRDSILQEIGDFRRRFPKASLICSSRPDRQLESSASLRVLHVKEMTLEQISQVVKNALFDDDKKAAFVDALESGLYERHTSFLSNPLLATIMLITYDVGSGVPNKLSLFYSQVYESLFYKHDSSKGVYVREHYSHLDIDEFERAFRTFCFQSYAMSRISFSTSALMDVIRSSLRQARVNASPTDFLSDCKKSLCLLQEDGLFTSFVHRSFQEYFAAKFLSSYGGDQYRSLVDEVVTRGFSDNTFTMLHQIDPEDVLRRWCLPKVSELISTISKIDLSSPESVCAFLYTYASSAYFDPDDGSGLTYSYAHRNEIRFVLAINEVLRASNIEQLAAAFRGNAYRNGDRESSPAAYLKMMGPELEEDEETGEEVPTGRYTISLSALKREFVLETGFPNMISDLLNSLRVVQTAIENRLDSTDEFAKRVGQLFDSSRG